MGIRWYIDYKNELFRYLLILWLALVCVFGSGASAYPAILKVGLADEPKTLNPFASKDIWALKVLSFCYQRLYYPNPAGDELVPWLASDRPVWDPETNAVTVRLREALWDDGSPFTADDVVYTAEVIRRFRIPGYWSNWEPVTEIEALDPRTVRITLKGPVATLWDRTLTTFVIQKARWGALFDRAEKALQDGLKARETAGQGKAKVTSAALAKPLQMISSYFNSRPESLGPFAFQQWERGSFIYLKRNEHFFARNGKIDGYLVGPHLDGILLKLYMNMDMAILALKRGDIDYLWWGIESGYLEDLKKNPRIKIYSVLKGGYRYLGLNLRRPGLRDRSFRHAVAHLIDKDFIIRRILHNQGVRLDTLVPPDNARYFCQDTPRYGVGLSWRERVEKARAILHRVGYRWEVEPVGGDVTGHYVTEGEGLKLPDGQPFPRLSIMSPPADYDAQRAQTANLIQQWLKGFGVPVTWRPLSFGAMTRKVRDHAFDLFVSGWGALGRDPDYLRSFFHSRGDRPGGKNMVGYHNPQFDHSADLQAVTMNLQKRCELIFRLQEILMHDLPYIPLYVPMNLEGVRADRYQGWVTMPGGIGNLWSFIQVKPTGTKK